MSATPSVKRKTEAEIKKMKDDQLSAEETRRNAEREEREKEERWLSAPWNQQMAQNPKKFSKFNDKTDVHDEKACFKDYKVLALRLNELLVSGNHKEICAIIIRCIEARKIARDKNAPSKAATTKSTNTLHHEEIINKFIELQHSVCRPINLNKAFFYTDNSDWRSVPILAFLPHHERLFQEAHNVGCLAGPQAEHYEIMMHSKARAKGKKSYKKKYYKKKSVKKTRRRRHK
jgi:hypothetical protein